MLEDQPGSLRRSIHRRWTSIIENASRSAEYPRQPVQEVDPDGRLLDAFSSC